jgi:heme-degrading monooxygenase HmoA
MVVYVLKYDIRSDKTEAFVKWATESAIPRILKIPGLVEFCSYRPVTGPHQIASTYFFKDAAAVAAWMSHADFEKITAELRSYATDVYGELWNPSPVVPERLHPKK